MARGVSATSDPDVRPDEDVRELYGCGSSKETSLK